MPVADPSAVVRPRVNLSADSSQINTALLEDPLLINIPESFTGTPVKLAFNSKRLSSIFKLVVSKYVRSPLTVRSPATVKSFAIETSFGRLIVTLAVSDPDPDTLI